MGYSTLVYIHKMILNRTPMPLTNLIEYFKFNHNIMKPEIKRTLNYILRIKKIT